MIILQLCFDFLQNYKSNNDYDHYPDGGKPPSDHLLVLQGLILLEMT